MIERENPFWTFSLAVYAQPGVAEECLELQTRLNIDVNILLFCAWLGAKKKIELRGADFTAIDAKVEQWHNTVVRCLRAVRQSMKLHPAISDPEIAGLRKEVAAMELRAEQIEQAFLFEIADEIASTRTGVEAATAANISAYVQRHAGTVDRIALPKHLIAAAENAAQ